jgi:type III pantothenate kinase
MFLAIDIGNTNITIGVLIKNKWGEHRFTADTNQSVEHYEEHFTLLKRSLGPAPIAGVAVSSVVPQLTPIILEAIRYAFGVQPYLLEKKWYSKLPVSPTNTDEIGTDLVANALAAWQMVQNKLLVVDFGTALTYTYVSETGNIEGVAIAPGIQTSMNSLSSNAAQLPEINLDLPEHALGTNTVEAMKAGILWGFVGQVQYLIQKIKQEKGGQLITIATGGLSEVLEPLSDSFNIVDRHLTLKGLNHFYKLMN